MTDSERPVQTTLPRDFWRIAEEQARQRGFKSPTSYMRFLVHADTDKLKGGG